MNSTISDKVSLWKSELFDETTRARVAELEKNEEQLYECFYKNLEFGTGGMRGIMDVGTNRLNKYTIGLATQALANYVNEQFSGTKKVVIAFDCRNNNTLFSDVAAQVLAANGIEVFQFPELRATPELSFAVRYLKCQAGIVITASHNPPEYNGYKIYWSDGAQIVPPHDKNIIDTFYALNIEDVKWNGNQDLIQSVGKEVDEAFFNACVAEVVTDNPNKEKLSIVFSSLHGTSITAIPPVLERAGFSNVHIIEEQAKPDGNFPTVDSPNPEDREAFEFALLKCEDVGADIALATDPDADRIGVAVRDLNNEMILLNGNQTAAVMTDYLLRQWKAKDKLNGKQFIGTTVVTSPILIRMAEKYEVEAVEVLTGFKWIADAIGKQEGKKTFIGGGEESYGFLIGDFVRDKDSVTAALLVAEIANALKNQGKSIYEYLMEIYQDYGLYWEHLISLKKTGAKGAEEIQQIIANLRNNPPSSLGGEQVTVFKDFKTLEAKNMQDGSVQKILLPASNVLIFETEKGSRIAVRPSGTEPKIKFYFSVNCPLPEKDAFENMRRNLQDQIDLIAADFVK